MIPWSTVPLFIDPVSQYFQNYDVNENWFLIRDHLKENGEFIASIFKTEATMQDELMKMDHCVLSLQNRSEEKFYFLPDEANESKIISYSQMKVLFNAQQREALALNRTVFLEGLENSGGGLYGCLEQLKGEAMGLRKYSSFEHCKNVESYRFKKYFELDYYCPPKPVRG
jgi:hypothetical protein